MGRKECLVGIRQFSSLNWHSVLENKCCCWSKGREMQLGTGRV